MNLRYKIPVLMLIVVIPYVILSYALLRGLLLPKFLELEKQEARKDILRCMEGLRREITHLDTVTRDWAAWDDMYHFVQRPSAKFIQSNLAPQTFIDNNINIICIFTIDRKPIWNYIWDEKTAVLIDIRDRCPYQNHRGSSLFQLSSRESVRKGLFMSQLGPMIVVSRPIITTDHQGPLQGYFLMGRLLNRKLIDSLNEQTQVTHDIFYVTPDATDRELRNVMPQLTDNTSVAFKILNKNEMQAFAIFPDITGTSRLVFRLHLPREIYGKGLNTLRWAFTLVCLSGMIMLLALFFFLHKIVLAPLSLLTRYVTQISSGNLFLPAAFADRNDEIGLMYVECMKMVERIQMAHMQLENTNEALRNEILRRKDTEKDLLNHQNKLRKMASELLLTEEKERRHIATDLHDRIGQNLALVQIKLDSLVTHHPECCTLSHIAEISLFMDNIIKDTRSLIFDISPPVLYEVGLEAAIEWLGEDMSAKYDITIAVNGSREDVFLATELRISVYRAIRELFLNALKHANASYVTVNIGYPEGSVRIEVTDDGCGFDQSGIDIRQKNKGFGLFSLKERLSTLGGTIDIVSAPSKGTKVVIMIPFNYEV